MPDALAVRVGCRSTIARDRESIFQRFYCSRKRTSIDFLSGDQSSADCDDLLPGQEAARLSDRMQAC